jgi:hypothetical protein
MFIEYQAMSHEATTHRDIRNLFILSIRGHTAPGDVITLVIPYSNVCVSNGSMELGLLSRFVND